MHNQPPRPDVLAHVGANLRRLRQEAGLSQAALAETSGMSRRMLVSLEAGDTNISLASLDRLAATLGATFVDIVSDPEAETQRAEIVAWRGSQPESEAVLLGSVPARREAQLWRWSLGRGERYDADPDPAGWHEMVYVVEGVLDLELSRETRRIAAGDFAIYSSAQTYAYVNAADTITRFVRNAVA